MSDNEIEQLKALLAGDDWQELLDDADEGFAFVTEQHLSAHYRFNHVRVITRAPSGQHYAWEYGAMIDPEADDISPTKIGSKVTPVRAVEETKTIVITTWVAS